MINRITEILSSRWLIHRETALSYLPLFLSFLNGGEKFLSFMTDDEQEKKLSRPRALAIASGTKRTAREFSLDDPSIPDNSIAYIPISGTILSWKSFSMAESIQKALNNENIISIVFPVNSPGGMVFYTDNLARQIKNSSKPTVAVIMNMAASAALWLASAMNYRIATSQMDLVGSIGTLTSFTDVQVLLKEKLGINIIDIYATKSTRKNEMTRALLAGDQSLIVRDLDFVNEIFHKEIRENLGIDKESEVFSGAIYNATDALGLGLINEINSLDYAIEYAYTAGLTNKINQFKF